MESLPSSLAPSLLPPPRLSHWSASAPTARAVGAIPEMLQPDFVLLLMIVTTEVENKDDSGKISNDNLTCDLAIVFKKIQFHQ